MKIKYLYLIFSLSLLSLSAAAQEIGLQQYSLRHDFPNNVEEILQKIHGWGITKLEDGLGGTYGLSQEEYARLLKKYELEVVSVSATFEELRDNPEVVLQRAKQFNAKYAFCPQIPPNDTLSIEEVRMALDVLNKAGKVLKDEGITLTYHNHSFEFGAYKTGTLMDYMIVNATDFYFEMDVYWYADAGQDPLVWMQKYPEKYKLMHLKDSKNGITKERNIPFDPATSVILGTGKLDIAAILKEAKKTEIEYIFIEDESSNALEQIPQSISYLKTLGYF